MNNMTIHIDTKLQERMLTFISHYLLTVKAKNMNDISDIEILMKMEAESIIDNIEKANS